MEASAATEAPAQPEDAAKAPEPPVTADVPPSAPGNATIQPPHASMQAGLGHEEANGSATGQEWAFMQVQQQTEEIARHVVHWFHDLQICCKQLRVLPQLCLVTKYIQGYT